jgi:phosphoribosyl-ATP pyrophosphohydrolase
MLKEIWDAQFKLNDRVFSHGYYRDFFTDLCDHLSYDDEDSRVEWLLNFNRALIHESVELEDSTPWKWWKGGSVTDWDNVKIELIDMLHFLISMMQVAGMSPQEVYELYMKKNNLNHHRQDVGYDENYKKEKDGVEDNKRMDEILGGKNG